MTDKQLADLGMHTEEPVEWTLDPVCGMEVDPDSTPFKAEFERKTYHFCNKSCFEHFKADPSRYAL